MLSSCIIIILFLTASLEVVDGSVCQRSSATFTCTVDDGLLRWRNSNGANVGAPYTATSIPGSASQTISVPGANNTILDFTVILTSVSGNILISNATLSSTVESVTLQCADGGGNSDQNTVNVKG